MDYFKGVGFRVEGLGFYGLEIAWSFRVLRGVPMRI